MVTERHRRQAWMRLAMAAASLILAAPATPGELPEDLPAPPLARQVRVMVDGVSVSLSTFRRFEDVAKQLPEPGDIPEADQHSLAHDAHNYCYRYLPQAGDAHLLQFHDSEFGTHTATLSRIGRDQDTQCGVLKTMPYFVVGTFRMNLDIARLPRIPGLTSQAADAGTEEVSGDWDVCDGGKKCFWFKIAIRATHRSAGKGGYSSMWIENWAEPG